MAESLISPILQPFVDILDGGRARRWEDSHGLLRNENRIRDGIRAFVPGMAIGGTLGVLTSGLVEGTPWIAIVGIGLVGLVANAEKSRRAGRQERLFQEDMEAQPNPRRMTRDEEKQRIIDSLNL